MTWFQLHKYYGNIEYGLMVWKLYGISRKSLVLECVCVCVPFMTLILSKSIVLGTQLHFGGKISLRYFCQKCITSVWSWENTRQTQIERHSTKLPINQYFLKKPWASAFVLCWSQNRFGGYACCGRKIGHWARVFKHDLRGRGDASRCHQRQSWAVGAVDSDISSLTSLRSLPDVFLWQGDTSFSVSPNGWTKDPARLCRGAYQVS